MHVCMLKHVEGTRRGTVERDLRSRSLTLESAPKKYCLLVGCLTSQQHSSVSLGPICSDNCTCCHTEIEAADQTFYLTQLHYADTWPTDPGTDPIKPGAWQGSHWSVLSKSLV